MAVVAVVEDHLAVHHKGQSLEGQHPAPGCPTPATHTTHPLGPPLRPALILPMLPLHPRFQPLRVLLSTRRGLLKRQGRSAGAAGGHFLPAHSGHIQGSSKDSRGYTSGNGGFGLYVVYSPREPVSTQGFGGGILGGY